MKAGQVGVNAFPMVNADLSCPWIGQKGSGFGYHSGPDGWRQFSVPQSIVSKDPLDLTASCVAGSPGVSALSGQMRLGNRLDNLLAILPVLFVTFVFIGLKSFRRFAKGVCDLREPLTHV